LTIRRTLAHGRLAGLVTGLGVATADALYSVAAAFSLTLITNLLLDIATPVRLLGGIFLLYLGIKTLFTPPADHAARAEGRSLGAMYLSALALTIANPMTILTFAGIFAGAGLSLDGSPLSATIVVAGVAAGSALWWFTLTGIVNLLSGHFTPKVMRWVNRVSGAVIIVFALTTLWGLVA
jgi:threonine/homoserine/homoserine lactone efflux protein